MKTYDEASTVTATAGQVAVVGPDGVDVRLTPKAALETCDRLAEAAARAAGLQMFEQFEIDHPDY